MLPPLWHQPKAELIALGIRYGAYIFLEFLKLILFRSHDGQNVGRPLVLTDGTLLPQFEGIDDDGGIYGDITFKMTNFIAGMTFKYTKLNL